MNLIKKSASALGKLFVVIALAGSFVVGMTSVVYMSLQGEEIKVPELVGKDFVQSEDSLENMGLRIKRRADRYSTEKPNTILEQLPKPGETVKTGQMILVVTSKQNPDGDEAPVSIKKVEEEKEEDIEKIEELISDKPIKSDKSKDKSTKKKSSKTRDIIKEKTDEDKDSDADKKTDADAKDSDAKKTDSDKKDKSSDNNDKKPAPADSTKPKKSGNDADKKPKPAKTPGTGDTRPRVSPNIKP